MDDMHPLAVAVTIPLMIAVAVLLLWWTVVAFTGGRMPIIGIETQGGLGFGLFWVFIVDPIAAGVLAFLGSIVSAAVNGVAEGGSRR
ncbi:MAG TPA: hypothetical protein VFD59_04595 [Nocardioidaceae bacterium]|nr:hypothetical protein [Nocardioidaceae bacterium]